MAAGDLFGRSVSERCIWYDDLGTEVVLPSEEALQLAAPEAERILSWQIETVLRRISPLDDETVIALVRFHPAAEICRHLVEAAAITRSVALHDDAALPAGLDGELGRHMAA